jgi:hypothetical protein
MGYGLGRLHTIQDAAWRKAKEERRLVIKNGQSVILTQAPLITPPSSFTLGTFVLGKTYEPPPHSTDSKGISYTDGYYANFCGAGAGTVAMGSWGDVLGINNRGLQAYTEPASAPFRLTTNWDDTNNRSYLMYFAEQLLVPGWSQNYSGVVDFYTYPLAGTQSGTLTDALNWEASGHSSQYWKNFYYGNYAATGLSESQFNFDITGDLGLTHRADVLFVTTSYLPSWSRGGVIHAISVIGYDNNKGTYTYVETCGSDGCGSLGQGIYTMPQHQLYQAMENAIQNGSNVGALIW